VLLLAYPTRVMAEHIVTRLLIASLDDGSLAGTKFPVSVSFDADQVTTQGDSFLVLRSFDFTLLGVAFSKSDIFQGGQMTFRNGRLTNVTASFQIRLPPNAPVKNITFGFGGDGVIGYIDHQDQYGTGSFVFAAADTDLNAASLTAGQPLAPGSLVTIIGSGFGVSPAQPRSIPLSLMLGGTSVTIGGVPAFLR
jgi:hypothetical protein